LAEDTLLPKTYDLTLALAQNMSLLTFTTYSVGMGQFL